MKKNKRAIGFRCVVVLVGIVLMIIVPGCGPRVIPEISPVLYHEPLVDLKDKKVMGRVIKNGADLVLVTEEGQVLRWNPGTGMTNLLYRLPFEVQAFDIRDKKPRYVDCLDYSVSRDFIVLKQKDVERFYIFDVKAMKETVTIENREIIQVVGINDQYLVYVDRGKGLVVWDYRSGSGEMVFDLKVKEGKPGDVVYNCEFAADKIVILTGSYIYIYYKGTGMTEKITLKYPAASPFFLEGDRFYYGSRERYFISFSLESKKPRWKFKIGDVLSSRPCKVGPYIVVVPEDNNIHFFTRGGSLHWWEKLDSTMLLPPLPMEKNAAVILWDNSVKFFNYKRKETITYRLEDGRMAISNAVKSGEYVFLLTGNHGDSKRRDEKLIKIGNHYGVNIDSEPADILSAGKSIKFELSALNLVKPSYDVTIERLSTDEAGAETGTKTVVFNKSLAVYDLPSFVWVPRETGRYRLNVVISAGNKKGLMVSKTFDTIDVDKILEQHYYDVQTQCEDE